MNVVQYTNRHERLARHVEVLTSEATGYKVGYKLIGSRSGPTILVAGHEAVASAIFDRLLNLPTLPWLRGNMYLILIEAFDASSDRRPLTLAPGEEIDELLFLPYARQEAHLSEAREAGYWSVLRLCARLWMIDGRGVPQED